MLSGNSPETATKIGIFPVVPDCNENGKYLQLTSDNNLQLGVWRAQNHFWRADKGHVTINSDVAWKLYAGGRWRIQKGGLRSQASRTDLWRREESVRNLSPCMETQGHPTIQSLQNPLTNLIERYGPVIVGFLGLWIVIFVREWLCVSPPKMALAL